MSAIERRIADFSLKTRSCSGTTLHSNWPVRWASAVQRGQVHQKLGFKGYPDLKYSIGEAAARAENGDATVAAAASRTPTPATAASLAAQVRSRGRDTPDQSARSRARGADAIGEAARCHHRLRRGRHPARASPGGCRCSIPTIHNFDAAHMTASVSAAAAGDVLLVFCEDGKQIALSQICHQFRKAKGRSSPSPAIPPTPCAPCDLACWCRRTTIARTSSRCYIAPVATPAGRHLRHPLRRQQEALRHTPGKPGTHPTALNP